jgi:hypothetical protein
VTSDDIPSVGTTINATADDTPSQETTRNATTSDDTPSQVTTDKATISADTPSVSSDVVDFSVVPSEGVSSNVLFSVDPSKGVSSEDVDFCVVPTEGVASTFSSNYRKEYISWITLRTLPRKGLSTK